MVNTKSTRATTIHINLGADEDNSPLKGKNSIARDMLAERLPLDTISRYTQVSVAELMKIQLEI